MCRGVTGIYLTGAFFVLLLGGLGAFIVRDMMRQDAWFDANRRLLTSGRPATAMVKTVGPSRRGRLVFIVSLDVQPAGEPAFAAAVEVLVPAHAAGAIAPNKSIAVRYDAASKAMAVDFAAMGYAPAP